MAAGEIVYLNGEFLESGNAGVPLEERGLLFADGVYEVLRFYGGNGFRAAAHVERLRQSLALVEIPAPACVAELEALSLELLKRNGLRDATVYWQFSRGVATRDPVFPATFRPTVFALAYPQGALDLRIPTPISTITTADLRWHRCCVKSIQLLPNVLARNEAARAGCAAAILLRGQTVTESTSANVAMVRDGALWTHPADDWILDGITRRTILECAAGLGMDVIERSFRRFDLLLADEAFVCGTTTHVTPIAEIDGRLLRSSPGPWTEKLFLQLMRTIADETGQSLS